MLTQIIIFLLCAFGFFVCGAWASVRVLDDPRRLRRVYAQGFGECLSAVLNKLTAYRLSIPQRDFNRAKGILCSLRPSVLRPKSKLPA